MNETELSKTGNSQTAGESASERGRLQVLGSLGANSPEVSKLLTPAAILFLTQLQQRFGATRERLLKDRITVQAKIDAGWRPDFLEETRSVRAGEWKVAPIPQDILDRRVEITGPVDRKMVINALNSGAQVFMADLEDSHSPVWESTVQGHLNLQDAVRKILHFTSAEGKSYSLHEKTAVLFVRPRGWHLVEKNILIDGQPMSASLFDFGLYFFHNAKESISRGTGPYFYLPKLESHLEARLWNDVFVFAQNEVGIPQGTIRATVLIETILAAFEMDEILYELKDHSAGLNCGRWDYIFSYIKKFRNDPTCVLPDRAQVTMDVHFLKSYCQLLVETCHRRGIHAMGGMAAQIPIKNDPDANRNALDRVTLDKKREVNLGHDGTWVAHPGLVAVARKVFDESMPGPNQINVSREEWHISAADLLRAPAGEITEEGLRKNINISLLYLESWLRGVGCVPLYNLMEDAATAEISRAQIWQWIRHGKFTKEAVLKILAEEFRKIELSVGADLYRSGKYELANQVLTKIITSHEFVEFITLPAYSYL
ncbi:MAG: malate synthase A [Bdellovibrionia bacterium]